MDLRKLICPSPVFLTCVFVLFLVVLPVSPAKAGEGFGNHAMGGGEDFNTGNLPPPGSFILINYFASVRGTAIKDNSGHDETIPGLGKISLTSRTVADSIRLVNVTRFKVLNGDFLWHVIVPGCNRYTDKKVSGIDLGTQSKTGLGDIAFGGGIAWHPATTFHCVTIVSIYAPTGAYHLGEVTNIGRNYWSINPSMGFTYKGDKDSPLPGFEASAKVMYWINTINTDTSYTSGQEISVDYILAKHIGKWGFGVNGYATYQFMDDKAHGHKAHDPVNGLDTGMRGKSFSAGPALSYGWPGWCITVKYQWDLYVRNRVEMNNFWLKVAKTF